MYRQRLSVTDHRLCLHFGLRFNPWFTTNFSIGQSRAGKYLSVTTDDPDGGYTSAFLSTVCPSPKRRTQFGKLAVCPEYSGRNTWCRPLWIPIITDAWDQHLHLSGRYYQHCDRNHCSDPKASQHGRRRRRDKV